MLVLGIDTSTPIGSVGITENDKPLAELTLNVETTHSERLLESIDFLLKNSGVGLSDIELIAYAQGPGSFTGLRIGLATVKGIALSTGKKIIGVSSLKSLAMNFIYSKYPVCTMIDARKNEVYSAIFELSDAKPKMLGKEIVVDPGDLIRKIRRKTVFVGTGARLYKDLIKKKAGKLALIAPSRMDISRGVNVAALGLENYRRGKTSDLNTALPKYLRKSQAELNYRD